MKKNTHLLGGAALALLLEKKCLDSGIDIISIKTITNLGMYYSFSLLGSIFPDIDKERTYISTRIPHVSKFINKSFGHRTITHSLTFFLVLVYLFSYLEINMYLSAGFLVGYLSHIILDMFNIQGVQLFYPFKSKVTIMKIKTSTIYETIFKYLLIVSVFVLIICR